MRFTLVVNYWMGANVSLALPFLLVVVTGCVSVSPTYGVST